jgi:hypothetical protein
MIENAIAVLLFVIEKCDRYLVFLKSAIAVLLFMKGDRGLVIFENVIVILLSVVGKCDRGFVVFEVRSLLNGNIVTNSF